MTNGDTGAASQEQLKIGNVCKTGGAQSRDSWVSFGSQAHSAGEAASQTTEKSPAARWGSPIAENAALSACGPIRAQDSKEQSAQASAGGKILKAERGGFDDAQPFALSFLTDSGASIDPTNTYDKSRFLVFVDSG